jgi:hypothetical protein
MNTWRMSKDVQLTLDFVEASEARCSHPTITTNEIPSLRLVLT